MFFSFMEWHSAYCEEIYRTLETQERGLSREAAALRLKRIGKNAFREYKETGAVQIFFPIREYFSFSCLLASALFRLLREIGRMPRGTLWRMTACFWKSTVPGENIKGRVGLSRCVLC